MKKIIISTEKLKKYREQKLSCKEIGLLEGCCKDTVSARLKELGMPIRNSYKYQDMTGKKLGLWTVICSAGIDKYRSKLWKCKCKCGTIRIKSTRYLIKQNHRSCGCSRVDHCTHIPSYYWNNIRSRAKKKQIEFTISSDYIWQLFQDQQGKCNLTGIPIELIKQFQGRRDQTASLDRIDSNKGYIESNVQWIHKDINRMKSNFDQKYFIKMCNLISSHTHTT